ncbi:MAG: flagellar motor switch protein FliG [Myxococcota bacterium]
MTKSTLSGAEKAAVVFLHMGEETASEAFKSLTRREIKLLSTAARSVQHLNQEQVEAILKDFIQEMESGYPELRGGHEFVTLLASRSLGAQKAKEFLDDEGGLTDTLADVDAETIAGLIRKEHPQTTALIMAHLPPDRGAEVLVLLPEAVQADVLRRLATLESVSPEVVELVEQALLSEIQSMGKGVAKKVGGINLVADILNQVERTREQTLMSQLEHTDEALAEEVRGLMFVFDDLVNVDGKGMQQLMQEVDRDTLVLALKAVDEDLREHFFSNLSKRARDMIIEDMENRGPVRLSEVESAQADIVRIALQMLENGDIEISKGGEDAYV